MKYILTTQAVTKSRNRIVEIIASLLLLFFVYTACSSVIQFQTLKNVLAFYTINISFVAWTMILAEVTVALLIFFPRVRLIGFFGALLIIIFAGITILRNPYFPHDFGGLFNLISRNQKLMLIASVALLSLSGVSLSLYGKRHAHLLRTKEHAVVYT